MQSDTVDENLVFLAARRRIAIPNWSTYAVNYRIDLFLYFHKKKFADDGSSPLFIRSLYVAMVRNLIRFICKI